MNINSHADPASEKREAYGAASNLLSRQDADSLRYAALELRRCIEAIVYEKLKGYGQLLPEDSVHQWQPPQAFDALIAIEPKAENTLTFAVAKQAELSKPAAGPYQVLGVDERPKGRWIKKTWHKLGFYLHADWPFAVDKPRTSPRPFLEKTLAELAPLVNNSFTAMLSNEISFPCSGCGEIVRVMEKAVESTRQATCLKCGMPYKAEESENSFTFYPDQPPFTCDCGVSTFIPLAHVEIGYRFSCRGCKRTFETVECEWKYVPIENAHPPGSGG
jgi:hypothetical protein